VEHCGDDFGKLVDAWMCLSFGIRRYVFFGEPFNVTAKDRLCALAELRDTSIGQPKQMLEHEVAGEKPLPKIVIVLEKPPPGQEARVLPTGRGHANGAHGSSCHERPINGRGSDAVAFKLRGLSNVHWLVCFAAAAFNLRCLTTLMAAPA
jgi:hypothetical protein